MPLAQRGRLFQQNRCEKHPEVEVRPCANSQIAFPRCPLGVDRIYTGYPQRLLATLLLFRFAKKQGFLAIRGRPGTIVIEVYPYQTH